MTKYDDRECIRGAAYDEAELRKQCREGTERYLQALIAGRLPTGGEESRMTDTLFDDPEALLAAATLTEIRDATPLSRAEIKQAQAARLRALEAEGHVTKVGGRGLRRDCVQN